LRPILDGFLEFANTSNIPFFKRGGEQFQPKKKKKKKPFENLFSICLIFNGARNTHQNKRTRPLLTLQDHKLRSTFETNFFLFIARTQSNKYFHYK
jgi:hypothetical protein